MASANGHQIGLFLAHNLFGELRRGNKPDGHGYKPRMLLDQRGEIDLMAGGGRRDLRSGRQVARRHHNIVDTQRFELPGKGDGLVDTLSVRMPVGGIDPDAERLLLRPDRPDRAHHFERKPHAVLHRAAIDVGAVVGDRRQELVQQIAVRRVDLENIEAGPAGADGGVDKGLCYAGNVVRIHCFWACARSRRSRRRRDRRSARPLLRWQSDSPLLRSRIDRQEARRPAWRRAGCRLPHPTVFSPRRPATKAPPRARRCRARDSRG